jgi:hypothetical protein
MNAWVNGSNHKKTIGNLGKKHKANPPAALDRVEQGDLGRIQASWPSGCLIIKGKSR